jgi:hypothetical protein
MKNSPTALFIIVLIAYISIPATCNPLVGIYVYGNDNRIINPETGQHHTMAENVNVKWMNGGAMTAIDNKRYFIHNSNAEYSLTIVSTNMTQLGTGSKLNVYV